MNADYILPAARNRMHSQARLPPQRFGPISLACLAFKLDQSLCLVNDVLVITDAFECSPAAPDQQAQQDSVRRAVVPLEDASPWRCKVCYERLFALITQRCSL